MNERNLFGKPRTRLTRRPRPAKPKAKAKRTRRTRPQPKPIAEPYASMYPPLPVVKARRTKRPEVWSVRCPYCGGRHFHGSEPGHRIEHCHQDADGYIVEAPTDWPKARDKA